MAPCRPLFEVIEKEKIELWRETLLDDPRYDESRQSVVVAMDDFVISTGVIASGARLVFAADAVALEPVAVAAGAEFGRKVRVITQGLSMEKRSMDRILCIQSLSRFSPESGACIHY